MNNIEEIFKDYPEILEPKLKMEFPNEDLIFHKGTFILKWKNFKIELIGKIVFKWLPDLKVKFYGNFPKNIFDTRIIKPFETNLIIEVESQEKQFYAKGILLNINTDNKNYNVIGYIKPPVTFGDLDKNVEEVFFEIPNLRDFHGKAVKHGTTAYKNRIIFNNKEYKITLDKYINFMEMNHELKEKGGYSLLYTGKLESTKKRAITYNESENILESFSYFLNFINGRRTSPVFRYGMMDSKEQWKSISPYFVDSFKYVISWPAKFKIEGLSETWRQFSELWKSESDRNCIMTVLHWYVEANSNTAHIEGSIVLIQNALELLFHWLIAEKKNYVNQSDADNISASVKIGFLLSNYNIKSTIPDELIDLKKFAKQNSITNGPDSFIRIRNCIVHPSKKKRKTLLEIEHKAKFDALNLGIWYVEVIILKHLKFKGAIQNRFAVFSQIDSKIELE